MVYIGPETTKAISNFPLSGEKTDAILIRAMAMVKLACCKTNTDQGWLSREIGNAIASVCQEIIEGKYHELFLVDPFQGGAGTSFNMNINEVVAYLAGQLSNLEIDPLLHVNLHQSTNDTFPTAVKVAVLLRLKELESSIA